jgi:hypothetical protein
MGPGARRCDRPLQSRRHPRRQAWDRQHPAIRARTRPRPADRRRRVPGHSGADAALQLPADGLLAASDLGSISARVKASTSRPNGLEVLRAGSRSGSTRRRRSSRHRARTENRRRSRPCQRPARDLRQRLDHDRDEREAVDFESRVACSAPFFSVTPYFFPCYPRIIFPVIFLSGALSHAAASLINPLKTRADEAFNPRGAVSSASRRFASYRSSCMKMGSCPLPAPRSSPRPTRRQLNGS